MYGDKAVHRVSKRFFSKDGEFYKDMLDHIDGKGLAESLALELKIYEGVPLDETIAEASHRDVHRFTGHATAGRLAWWASTQRLMQNLAAYDVSVVVGNTALFHDCTSN